MLVKHRVCRAVGGTHFLSFLFQNNTNGESTTLCRTFAKKFVKVSYFRIVPPQVSVIFQLVEGIAATQVTAHYAPYNRVTCGGDDGHRLGS